MDLTAPASWPFDWISAGHARGLLTMLLIPLLQAVTGAMGWCAFEHRFDPSPRNCGRWQRFALGAVFPLAVAWTAVRWLGTPHTATALETDAWLAWLGLFAGLVVLATSAAWAMTRKRTRSGAVLVWAGALGGLAAVASWALISSFQLEPGAWLEYRTLRAALRPPAFPWVLVAHVAATCSLGSALALWSNTTRPRLARAVASVSAAVGSVTVLTAPAWLPVQLAPPSTQDLAEQGASGPAWATRWLVVTLVAWVTFALVAAMGPRSGSARALVLFACLAACGSQGLWASYRGPWHVRGWMYANGLEVEHVRANRRSPSALTAEQGALGKRVFQARCAVCHASSGPMSSWRDTLSCDTVEVRRRLEDLREADRLGHPDREQMPPLIGSDREVDALARWLRSRRPCR